MLQKEVDRCNEEAFAALACASLVAASVKAKIGRRAGKGALKKNRVDEVQ